MSVSDSGRTIPPRTAQERMHEALDSCETTRWHYGMWGLAAGGTLLDGMTVASLGIALPLIEQTYTMSPIVVGAVSSASVVGMVIGAVAGGRASDHLGRRRMFLVSMSLIAFAS
ncbi:MAG: MFS transporter, partial [Planctomycetales bacterium]|nr:MFS transporter [Planctomycetales bacterium]